MCVGCVGCVVVVCGGEVVRSRWCAIFWLRANGGQESMYSSTYIPVTVKMASFLELYIVSPSSRIDWYSLK